MFLNERPFFRAILIGHVLIFGMVSQHSMASEARIVGEVQYESPRIATRGEATVTQADFDAYLLRVPVEHRATFLSSADRIGDVLHRLLRARQIHALAVASGEVGEQIAFQAALYQAMVTAVADYYMEQIVWPNARLADYASQAKELFLTRPDLLRLPDRVSFTQFLVQSEGVRGELDAMRSILNVYELLREGQALGSLAVEYSEDPSAAENQGRYNDIPVTDLEPEIARMLGVLEPGQVSQPFRSSFGWHIVELHERVTPPADTFESVRELAERVAERRHRESVRERMLRQLASEPIDFEPNAIADLLGRYGASLGDRTRLQQEVQDLDPSS